MAKRILPKVVLVALKRGMRAPRPSVYTGASGVALAASTRHAGPMDKGWRERRREGRAPSARDWS